MKILSEMVKRKWECVNTVLLVRVKCGICKLLSLKTGVDGKNCMNFIKYWHIHIVRFNYSLHRDVERTFGIFRCFS